MKKIFFLLSSMNVGGVEKAFLSMLPYIPHEKYEIHVGLLSRKGGFLDELPDYVHLHHITCYDAHKDIIHNPPLDVIRRMFRRREYIQGILHFFIYIHFKLTSNRILLYKYILKDEPLFPIHFDLAVAYAGPSQSIDYYVCKKIIAKKKCGWIHFDITKFGIDKGMTKTLYKFYDRIFLVSQTAKEKFDKLFPQFIHQTDVFYNIVSPAHVSNSAQKAPTFKDNYSGKRILTVGRISKEKGQDIAIMALNILKQQGKNIKWYFVGDGNFRTHCEALAKKYNLQDSVTFLGTEKNPYGYMRDCDVYVQPSRHEGYCITLAEARVFQNPIVATDFVGAKEQLATRGNATVTGFSATELAEGIMKALEMNKEASTSENALHTDVNKLLTLLD